MSDCNIRMAIMAIAYVVGVLSIVAVSIASGYLASWLGSL